jgi:NADP-dependent 3-hydroxy acid dehydrogenase YdfG
MEKKVVLITGASSGIGKETANLLIKGGYIVYGAARRLDKMNDLKEAGIKLLEMDVTNDESMVKGIQKIIETEKRIDVLVNNVPISEAKYQFEVNIFGLARLTQLVLPHMRKQQSGKIVNISSMGGKFGEPHGSWYHATKFAVEGLSDSLRMELKQFNIDVVIIEPGAIKSEWGGIAKENLLKVSGNTAYKNLATKHAALIDETYKRVGSEPIVIAKTIAKAISSNNPKTRYAVGGGAKILLFMRSLLSDKLFDKIFLSQLK